MGKYVLMQIIFKGKTLEEKYVLMQLIFGGKICADAACFWRENLEGLWLYLMP